MKNKSTKRAAGRKKLVWGPELYEIVFAGYETECWLWLRAKTAGGYGVFREAYAHRFSYESFVGPICPGFEIDHLCRNPSCVNPQHLQSVTHRENMRRGKQAKVTQETVEAIRTDTGLNREVADKYGLEESYVSRLRRRVARHH